MHNMVWFNFDAPCLHSSQYFAGGWRSQDPELGVYVVWTTTALLGLFRFMQYYNLIFISHMQRRLLPLDRAVLSNEWFLKQRLKRPRFSSAAKGIDRSSFLKNSWSFRDESLALLQIIAVLYTCQHHGCIVPCLV